MSTGSPRRRLLLAAGAVALTAMAGAAIVWLVIEVQLFFSRG